MSFKSAWVENIYERANGDIVFVTELRLMNKKLEKQILFEAKYVNRRDEIINKAVQKEMRQELIKTLTETLMALP